MTPPTPPADLLPLLQRVERMRRDFSLLTQSRVDYWARECYGLANELAHALAPVVAERDGLREEVGMHVRDYQALLVHFREAQSRAEAAEAALHAIAALGHGYTTGMMTTAARLSVAVKTAEATLATAPKEPK